MELLITLFTNKLGLDIGHFETFYAQLKTKNFKKKEYLIREGAVCNFTITGTQQKPKIRLGNGKKKDELKGETDDDQ